MKLLSNLSNVRDIVVVILFVLDLLFLFLLFFFTFDNNTNTALPKWLPFAWAVGLLFPLVLGALYWARGWKLFAVLPSYAIALVVGLGYAQIIFNFRVIFLDLARAQVLAWKGIEAIGVTKLNGHVYFNGTLIPEADPNSFQKISENADFYADQKNIYWCRDEDNCGLVRGADRTSLTIVDSANASDRGQIYTTEMYEDSDGITRERLKITPNPN